MRLMEEHTLRQPVMVSRLPKFGSRPPGGANLPVPKGSAIPSGPAAGAKALGAPRQNGIVQPPPTLSFRWKERVEPEESKGGAYRPQQQQQRAPITAREIKKPSAPVATTIRRSASSVSSTSHRTGHHPAPTRLAANHGLSNGLLTGPGHGSLSQSSDSLRLMPQDNMVRSQSFSHMTRVPGSGGAPITRSFSFNQELPRPNTRHTHPTQSPLTLPTTGLNGPRGSKMTGIARVQSAGTSLLAPANLKKPLLPAPASNKPSALSYRLMRPSLIRQPRPMPIGRAQEETAKDLGQRGQREGSESVWDDTLVAPHPSSPTRSADSPTATPQELAELPPQARADEPRADDDLADTVTHDEARAEDSRVQDQTEHPESTVSQTRLDDLRKVDVTKEDSTPAELTEVNPELVKPKVEDARAVDICAESKTGAVDPSPTESDHDETSATSERVDLQESSPEKDGHAGPEGVEGLPVLCVTSVTGEPLEDMSLSSTSSLERSNDDTSEEYMDDFDNLGNGGGVLLLPPTHDEGLVQSEPLSEDTTHPSRQQDGCSITSLHSFLSESVDWGEMGLTGGKEAFSIPGGGVSSDGVFRDGSSLDLSPSDSSGATYMWDDEDGLEPLGGTIIPCHSYDSDLNSMDILNNLDNLDSCDLEEDDLMLDVDLPEDASLHSEADGRSHWRKMQLWSRQDHLHNNNNSRDDLQSLGSLDGDQVDHVCLDELTLQHMAQDCTSVKNQLLQLKQLLQVEETDCSDEGVSSSEAFTPDISEDRSCDEQVQELLMEVQKLREELRNKDKMIAQLTQQMSVPEESSRCSCHLKKPETQKGTRPLHQDGTTQTPWRGHAGLLPPSLLPPWLCSKQSHPRARLPLLHRQSESLSHQTQPPLPSPAPSYLLVTLRDPL